MILSVGVKCLKLSKQSKENYYNQSMNEQPVWQDMDQAPKDREILVGIKSEEDGPIELDVVEGSIIYDTFEWGWGFEWYSPVKAEYYYSDDFIGWCEVPTQ